MNCHQCPRNCNVNRESALGFCQSPGAFRIARAALHFWEEPCISGTQGSGTIFFSGCNLKCVYCQNAEISRDNKGVTVSDEKLTELMQALVKQGAHNINLVNPTHYADRLAAVLKRYKPPVPVVYNSSGYESVKTLKRLEGLVDIYLPDMKYSRPDKAGRYSAAEDYPAVALAAIEEMARQQSADVFDENGMLQKGMIIRHLVLPGNTRSSLEVLDLLASRYLHRPLSVMAQYTPCGDLTSYPEINRQITRREYKKVTDYALSLGFEQLFLQKLSSADKNFIPAFDFSGIM